MRTRPSVIYFSPAERPVPDLVSAWMEKQPLPLATVQNLGDIETLALRNPPALIIVDADGSGTEGVALCRLLKTDPYTAIVPVAFLSGYHASEQVQAWFHAGADEVLTPILSPAEQRGRLDVLLSRTERSVSVHPSTRLPGTTEIERQIRTHLDSGAQFAVCYADLDHFKEFNDRYSYYDGDRVIFILSRILRDVVKGLCPKDGFVGHIGGDDFIMILPIEMVQEVCGEVLAVFDALVPYQYNAQDRRAGYFFGKDRRGHLHRVPLMTLSIGIVTNERRKYSHPAEVSELATEMKSYAKTLPGSVFVVDRRRDAEP
ncbi:MAG: diguanylate cyclase [Gemmatimonadales bacterium]|nr:diguanylate cyclase [Gemmatimonadales bacterium]